MRVLTVQEPWATCIALGRKRVENRPPRVAKFAERLIGEDLAFHAGLRRASVGKMAPDEKPWPEVLNRGHIVAVVTIDRVEPPGEPKRWDSTGRDLGPPPWRQWAESGIYFRNVRRLATPIPLRGGQGWRILERANPEAYRAVMEQL